MSPYRDYKNDFMVIKMIDEGENPLEHATNNFPDDC